MSRPDHSAFLAAVFFAGAFLAAAFFGAAFFATAFFAGAVSSPPAPADFFGAAFFAVFLRGAGPLARFSDSISDACSALSMSGV
jgi:hypothetical protein